MDRMDWRLVEELQADARLSYNELARRVHLSAPTVAERVRKLESSGVITGYRAHVDPAAVGLPVQAVVVMDCYGPRCLLRDPEVPSWPQIRQLFRITGDGCSVLVAAVPSMPDFESFIDRLARYGRPSSSMVLSQPLAWAPVAAPEGRGD
ncbi:MULTISPECIES: Lrp/AsnC family transcriptional regulator [Glycomyces]|uniref:AsnC family transcriptional regulator n=2 Tax=Glycomyces artemisiae TaxID=1076443 RepID=A0A2T0UPK1_9ACTN|nr:Lrp/AsnC family transcriptional regulator [Glycomyces artemisiae]PRY59853.1 AsnC family transcriptional regulator [Glycomyces artemisiae]